MAGIEKLSFGCIFCIASKQRGKKNRKIEQDPNFGKYKFQTMN